MAFKLTNSPYDKKIMSTPVYHVSMEDDVMGKANNKLPWEDEAYKNS